MWFRWSGNAEERGLRSRGRRMAKIGLVPLGGSFRFAVFAGSQGTSQPLAWGQDCGRRNKWSALWTSSSVDFLYLRGLGVSCQYSFAAESNPTPSGKRVRGQGSC